MKGWQQAHRRGWLVAAAFVLLGCGGDGGGAQIDTDAADDVSAEVDVDVAGSSDTSLPADTGGGGKGGFLDAAGGDGATDADVAEPVAPPSSWVRFPAEAVDLDPDPDVTRVALQAAQLSADHPAAEAGFRYAYNGQVPGPTIRLKVGERLDVDLSNALASPTTIHWHGMHVPVEMDGTTWQRAPIAAGESFRYTFTADRPGTFWYHPHFDTEQQVDLGLYGMVIVEAPAEPAVDRDIVLIFDTPSEWHPEGEHHHTVASGWPQWRVNGAEADGLDVVAGERIRARLLNASNTEYLALEHLGLRQLAGDQGLYSAPVESDAGPIVLAPGDRAELEWLPGAAPLHVMGRPYSLVGAVPDGQARRLVTLSPTGNAAAAAPAVWPFDGALPSPDPTYTDVVFVFQGSDEGGGWFINGQVFPDIEPIEMPLGETVIVEVRNLSHSEHPFHLHGMHVEVLSIDGVPPTTRRLEDTINVGINQRVRLQVLADNPGEWMAHCHILPHADGGMMTVVRVQ